MRRGQALMSIGPPPRAGPESGQHCSSATWASGWRPSSPIHRQAQAVRLLMEAGGVLHHQALSIVKLLAAAAMEGRRWVRRVARRVRRAERVRPALCYTASDGTRLRGWPAVPR